MVDNTVFTYSNVSKQREKGREEGRGRGRGGNKPKFKETTIE
jgi:hypothetical protein